MDTATAIEVMHEGRREGCGSIRIKIAKCIIDKMAGEMVKKFGGGKI